VEGTEDFFSLMTAVQHLILEVSRLHSLHAPQSAGLFWTSDQSDAETST
jgi:hypothetical protein